MRPYDISPSSRLKGRIILPGDKSIAHRAIILSSISFGRTVIDNFPVNNDCKASISVFLKLGIKIKRTKSGKIIVFGKGLSGLTKPKSSLFIEESGTTLRLLLGVLAAQEFETNLAAGKFLSQRPMLRVTKPLRMMGAIIKSTLRLRSGLMVSKVEPSRVLGKEEYTPINIKGCALKPIVYRMPVASAQVKSAILLAGLFAFGQTGIIEPVKTRDHTERMLQLFKARVKHKGNTIAIKGRQELVSPGEVYIPGDISSAAFFMVAAAIIPGSEILIRKVSLNPGRLGIVGVLKRMGLDISFYRKQTRAYEPLGDILVRSRRLKGARVLRREVPSLIDELPILMVAACFARGKTVFEGVGELRVKETDRIRSMSENLNKLGADVRVVKVGNSENIVIKGVAQLKGAKLKSFGDHRTAMSAVIAGLAASGKSRIDDVSCINKSFPKFLTILRSLER